MYSNYLYTDDFFLESFDSGQKHTIILDVSTKYTQKFFFAFSANSKVLEFIENFSFSNQSFLQVIKEIRAEFLNVEDTIFLGLIDYSHKKMSYIEFNIDYLFIKKVNGDLKIIHNETKDEREHNFDVKFHIKNIALDDLELLYVLNNNSCSKYFEDNCEDVLFVKDIIKNYYTKKENSEFSFMFLNALLPKISNTTYHYSIKAKKINIHNLEDEIEELLNSRCSNIETVSNAVTVLNELILNAYEHGALNINSKQKQKLIEEQTFEDYLKEQEEIVDEELEVELSIYDNNLLKMSIKDYGDGFNFLTLGNVTSSDYRGRGLLMSKKMSEALFFNEAGSKSTFFMKLSSAVQPREERDINDPKFYAKQLSILYVEDDKVIRDIFSKILKKYTQTLFVAEDGVDGLEIYDQFKPDIIITDIEMPEMDGLEMSAKIRESDTEIPIILTTAYNDENIFLEAIDIGVDKFLVKPIALDKLQKTVFKVAKDLYLKNEAKKRFAIEKRLKSKELSELKSKNKYITAEQKLAFEKEKLIIKDDSAELNIQCEIYYEPLDILSGDIYGISKIDKDQSLFYIIDSMGKGLSAAVTATLSAAFINRAIVISTNKGTFNLEKLIFDYNEYIKSYLLEYESVSLSFILVNQKTFNAKHASFGMYPVLAKDLTNGEVIRYKSNNPPLTKHLENYNIEKFKLAKKFNLIFYSDGIIEHEEFSLTDLKESFEKRDSFEEIKIDFESSFKTEKFAYEDDITAIFISNQ